MAYAGYRDKLLNGHTKGVRINCDGDPVDKKGKKITESDFTNPEKSKEISFQYSTLKRRFRLLEPKFLVQ